MYDAKDIFDKSDNAKLKNEKALDEAGKFLEQNKFRLAVVAASDEIGDTDKDRVLTQARAKVVRDYLVQNFKFDDTRVKIIGLGKSSEDRRNQQGRNPHLLLEIFAGIHTTNLPAGCLIRRSANRTRIAFRPPWVW